MSLKAGPGRDGRQGPRAPLGRAARPAGALTTPPRARTPTPGPTCAAGPPTLCGWLSPSSAAAGVRPRRGTAAC